MVCSTVIAAIFRMGVTIGRHEIMCYNYINFQKLQEI